MKIPDRLENLLNGDDAMRTAVYGSIAEFVPFIEGSNLPFFPDYTDHGIDHIQQVLATASSLIHDDAWAVMTPQDSAMLILTCLLHDSAMHLSKDGFIALVSDDKSYIEGMDTTRWPQLWQDYLFSAKRFDDRTLIDIFGDTTPVQVPPMDRLEMTERNQLLIGEFLRRHHPRLAHEIAVFGLPTHNGRRILLKGLDARQADLAGLIARSHGMPLRAVFPYMDRRGIVKHRYRQVHPIFLMALLRIADYLQIQSERAPSQLLEIKRIRSPFSLREHKVHHSVDDIHNYSPDPEAIEIQATPPDVKTFLRLKEWLSGIQSELDTSWAVLGEIYAPVRLTQLGLVIRRVRSNLDDMEKFAGNVSYVPKQVEFDVARAEILKLLVGPLYGNKPEIGIRELMQNSVDAVRELWDFQEQNPKFKDVEVLEQEGDVEVWLNEPDENGVAWLIVSDKGIGMTEEVITDYFLKVGASFRHSDAWAKQHEIPEEEQIEKNSPKSRVLRTGRFGIGALAAYLLGDEIEVSTRHVKATTGLRFTTKLDSETIELHKDNGLSVGTTMRIPITKDAYKILTHFEEWDTDEWNGDTWDWYCFSEPVVKRLFGDQRVELKQQINIPNMNDKLSSGWYEVEGTAFPKVSCSFIYEGQLVCNGIKIEGEMSKALAIEDRSSNIRVDYPLVSIFDPDNKLELNLARSEVDDTAEIRSQYCIARLRYFLAFLLTTTPTKANTFRESKIHFAHSRAYSRNLDENERIEYLFYTPNGLSIVEKQNILSASAQHFLVLPTYGQHLLTSIAEKIPYDAVFLVDRVRFLRGNRAAMSQARLLLSGFDALDASGGILIQKGLRLITTIKAAPAIQELQKSKGNIQNFRRELISDRWTSYVIGFPPPTKVTEEVLESLPFSETKDTLPFMLSEWYLSDKQPEIQPSSLAQEWQNIIREPVIPYDLKERREKLAHAYEILAPYLENMEQPEDL